MIQSRIYEVDQQSPSLASPWQAWPLLLAGQLDSEPGISYFSSSLSAQLSAQLSVQVSSLIF